MKSLLIFKIVLVFCVLGSQSLSTNSQMKNDLLEDKKIHLANLRQTYLDDKHVNKILKPFSTAVNEYSGNIDYEKSGNPSKDHNTKDHETILKHIHHPSNVLDRGEPKTRFLASGLKLNRIKRQDKSLKNKYISTIPKFRNHRLNQVVLREFYPKDLMFQIKKRLGMDGSGFHGDTFNDGWGSFSTMRKRPEMDASGFHGDIFSGGFGDFSTMKRSPEMTSSGFHGDMFSDGFGNFYTMKRNHKKGLEMSSTGFHGDTFSDGFGDFSTMKK